MKYLEIIYDSDGFDKNLTKNIIKPMLLESDLSQLNKNIDDSVDYLLFRKKSLKKRDDFNLKDFFNQVNDNIDIYLLNTYNEKCQILTLEKNYGDYNFYKSVSPGEIDAFAVSKQKWSEVYPKLASSNEEKINHKIKNLVINEDITACFSWPQIYYDKTPGELNICRAEKNSFISPRIKELSYYWFIMTVGFSILFIYIIYKRLPKDRFFYLDKTIDSKSDKAKELK